MIEDPKLRPLQLVATVIPDLDSEIKPALRFTLSDTTGRHRAQLEAAHHDRDEIRSDFFEPLIRKSFW